jgi:hypothetical protein
LTQIESVKRLAPIAAAGNMPTMHASTRTGQGRRLAGTGLEPVDASSSENKLLGTQPVTGAAESGAPDALHLDLDLKIVTESWHVLPAEMRQDIVAMVRGRSHSPVCGDDPARS